MSLWETFQEDFESFTEEEFRSAGNYNIRRLRDYLRKFGVWIRKQQRLNIARSLYEALLEEEPTPWTEAEIMACLDKEEFASYHINRLLESDFGRKPQKSGVFTLNSSSSPPPATTLSAPAPFALSSASPTPPAPAPVNASTILPSTNPFVPAPTPPPGTKPKPAAEPIIDPPSALNPPPAVITTSTGNGRELSNLANIYTDEAKYSGRNDSFTFKLTIFYDIYARADVPPEAKMKAFPTMLKGLALGYYYSNISINSSIVMNFDQICHSLRVYFKGAEYKLSVLSKWKELTLNLVISENECKPMVECLEQLIEKL